jgi:hypothetical protein
MKGKIQKMLVKERGNNYEKGDFSPEQSYALSHNEALGSSQLPCRIKCTRDALAQRQP